jgi:hypothetical protein
MKLFDEAMYAVLEPDAGLLAAAPGGVWRRLAPLDTPTPFVVFRQQVPDEDKYTLAGLAWRWLTYECAIVDRAESAQPALTALELAHALIQEQLTTLSAEMAGWDVAQVRRKQQTDGHFLDAGGRVWQTVANQYRVMVVPA